MSILEDKGSDTGSSETSVKLKILMSTATASGASSHLDSSKGFKTRTRLPSEKTSYYLDAIQARQSVSLKIIQKEKT